MGAEISVVLDIRRIKKEGVYPLKLRVYHGPKTKLYPTIYDLTEEDFRKFAAKRVGDVLAHQRDKINQLLITAQIAAGNIHPFDFKLFRQQFISGQPLFREKKTKLKDLVAKDSSSIYPEKWLKKFPILKEVHPGSDYASTVYLGIIKSLLFQGRIGNASAYQSSYSSLKAFRNNVRFDQVQLNI